MSRCSKKCNEIKAKIDSISGLDDDDDDVYEYLCMLENITNGVVIIIKDYADRDELNGTVFKDKKSLFNDLFHMKKNKGITKVERNN